MRPSNQLVFDELSDSGTDIQSLRLVNYIEILKMRLTHRYRYPDYDITMIVIEKPGLGIRNYLFRIRFSAEAPIPRDNMGPVLSTLEQQILDHGIRGLDAQIQINQETVGSLNIIFGKSMPISQTQLPLILAIGPPQTFFIEIYNFRPPSGDRAITGLFNVLWDTEAFFRTVPPEQPCDTFSKVHIGEGTEGNAHFAVRVDDALFTNGHALRMTETILNFILEYAPGYIDFRIFNGFQGYRFVATGTLVVGVHPGMSAGGEPDASSIAQL